MNMNQLSSLTARRVTLAPWQLSVIAAAYITAVSNSGLFAALSAGLNLHSLAGIGFLATIILLMLLLLVTVFLTVGHGWVLKFVIGLFIFASSILAYFCNQLGVVFDPDMLLNVIETVRDNNAAEAVELASFPLLQHVFIFGLVPVLLLRFVKLQPHRLAGELGIRIAVVLVGSVIFLGITLPNYRYVTYFARENSDLKLKITPIYPLLSMVKLTRRHLIPKSPFRVIDADAIQHSSRTRRSVGVMVVGETARADHFSMGRYPRQTNPQLEGTPGVMFAAADSCGTSTLFSVPCMFSMRGRDSYEAGEASSESNVLDILKAAGIKTVWIDNNSSCKDVCNRIENLNLKENPDENSEYFSDMGYFDEILVQQVEKYLGSDGPDTLIVLHTLGSHGPAYGRRYPASFGIFTPFCTQLSPTDCTAEEVANAYDNTIFYTDYVLGQLIKKLQARSDEIDSFLFYASDHGESLGENGIYLHGLPYAIAPAAQTNVPFIFWASNGFQLNSLNNSRLMPEFDAERRSHDNISHSLLGLYEVNASSYQRQLDIFANSNVSGGGQLFATTAREK